MILMNDFNAEPLDLREAMVAGVQRVVNSGWYILGKEVENFEHLWAKTCGVEYGVGVGNGLDAIEIALRGFGIGPGDEVITTPMTAFATVLAILRSGATPVLADIDPNTALLSLASVERCVSPKTKALVLVHLYGQIRNMSVWRDFCHAGKITLIEDCAQAHLAKWQGQYAGSFGRVGAYSFYPTKNLGALGDAGMIVTNDKILAHQASQLRNYGQSSRYHHPELGMNSRLDEIQAAILTERLKWLPEFTQRRQAIARAYHKGITHPQVGLLDLPEEESAHVYHLYVVTCHNREALQLHLKAKQIQSLIHYPIPVHHQIPCRNMLRDPNGLSYSEQHANNCLSLPCHPRMDDWQVEAVISAVNSFYAG